MDASGGRMGLSGEEEGREAVVVDVRESRSSERAWPLVLPLVFAALEWAAVEESVEGEFWVRMEESLEGRAKDCSKGLGSRSKVLRLRGVEDELVGAALEEAGLGGEDGGSEAMAGRVSRKQSQRQFAGSRSQRDDDDVVVRPWVASGQQ